MIDDNELVQEFLNEAIEHLAVLETELLGMEKAPEATEAETLNRIFRSVHSIKGTAGFLGFRNIIGLSHVMETLFDRFRKGQMQPCREHVEVLLESSDDLKAMVEDLSGEQGYDVSEKVAAIEKLLEAGGGEKEGEAQVVAKEQGGGTVVSGAHHHGAWASAPEEFPLRYTLEIDDLDAFERMVGITPVRLFKLLESVGFVVSSEFHAPGIGLTKNKLAKALPLTVYFVSDKRVPELEAATEIPDWYFQGDPEQEQAEEALPESKIHRVVFCPSEEVVSTPGAVDSVFKELREIGECKVSERGLASGGKEYRVEVACCADEARVKEAFFFVESGSSISFVSEFADLPEEGEVDGEKALGREEDLPVLPEVKAEEAVVGSERKAVSPSAAETLRVPSEKLDRLVNLVGEMVILQAQLMATSKRVADDFPDLQSTVEGMERLGAELRDIVLNIRMMPVGATFGKYHRLVRDLAKELKKEVELEIEGADTELDKTVLDQLGDPLVHLLRNSLDHGLETPEEREKRGKSRKGRICLTASHCGDRVVIGISDDGRGLDTERIRNKAVERGVISAEVRLGDEEIQQLIFAPGFSTAQQVTGISGRGVGMDVVKKKIELLGGEVKLESVFGRGTTILLSLPLTLAIIEGLMVEVDGDRVIVPLAIVTETIELTRKRRLEHNSRNMVDVRGHLVPYLRLRDLFGFRDNEAELERVVIVEQGGQRLGLVVDKVIGNHQTVIKSLGRLCRDVTHFSGATILGDGTVALVLDVPGLIRSNRGQIQGNTMFEV